MCDMISSISDDKHKFRCSACDVTYTLYCSLKTHAKRKHPDKVTMIAPNLRDMKLYKYACDRCTRKFNDPYNLNSHLRKVHNFHEIPSAKKEENRRCPLCTYESTEKEMHVHFEADHNLEIEVVDLNFDNIDEFKQWKDSTEKETKCRFVLKRGTVRLKSGSRQLYVCHRSGFYIPGGKGLRHLKTQGSCKIEGYCPAKIKIFESNEGACNVKFYKTHIGHENDIGHLHLTPYERQFIASKIASKIPFDDILREIKDSATDSQFGRIHLITKKDLYNIASCYKIEWSSVKHKDDDGSVEVRVDGMENEVQESDILITKASNNVSNSCESLSDKKDMLKNEILEILDSISTEDDLKTFMNAVRSFHPSSKARSNCENFVTSEFPTDFCSTL